MLNVVYHSGCLDMNAASLTSVMHVTTRPLGSPFNALTAGLANEMASGLKNKLCPIMPF